MKKEFRLKGNRDFRMIYRRGKSLPHRLMILIYVRARPDVLQFGFSVSKKVGGSVLRNRVKRQIREACRLLLPQLQGGYRIIFIARPPIIFASYGEIASAVRLLLNKAAIYRKSGEGQ